MRDENSYLESQLITYIGNKRSLLEFIGQGVSIVQQKLGKEKLTCLDVFSGSGIVSRYLKQYSSVIAANDLEKYSCIINQCYLSNPTKKEIEELKVLYEILVEKINKKMKTWENNRLKGIYKNPGFISELYAPQNIENIQKTERCFYTPYNGAYLDIARQLIETEIPEKYKPCFIAPLLSEASIHANTAGIFKGFYKNSKTGVGQFGGNGKNALTRITGNIQLPFPVFNKNDCKNYVFNQNANELVLSEDLYKIVKSNDGVFDLAYFDPPYNQHPYGSNYFMLNLLASYERPDTELISRVSGIPKNWNRSAYNKKRQVSKVFFDLVNNVRARFVLVSFNSEGFISKEEMISLLEQIGKVQVLESKYNTFRGSRNLNDRSIHVNEYLFLLEKNVTE